MCNSFIIGVITNSLPELCDGLLMQWATLTHKNIIMMNHTEGKLPLYVYYMSRAGAHLYGTHCLLGSD